MAIFERVQIQTTASILSFTVSTQRTAETGEQSQVDKMVCFEIPREPMTEISAINNATCASTAKTLLWFSKQVTGPLRRPLVWCVLFGDHIGTHGWAIEWGKWRPAFFLTIFPKPGLEKPPFKFQSFKTPLWRWPCWRLTKRHPYWFPFSSQPTGTPYLFDTCQSSVS